MRKQAMRKNCQAMRAMRNKQCEKIVFPQDSNLQPLDYQFPALPPELEKTSPYMLNLGHLNPATCKIYNFNNKSIMMFLKFAGQSFLMFNRFACF